MFKHSIKMSDKWDLSNKSIALFSPKISPPAVSETGCSVMKEPRLKNTPFFLKIGFSSREGKQRSCEARQKMRLPSFPSL